MRITESHLKRVVRRRLSEAASEDDLLFYVLWDVKKGTRIDVTPETEVWKKSSGNPRGTPAGQVPEIRKALEGDKSALPTSAEGSPIPLTTFEQPAQLERYVKGFLEPALSQGFKNDVYVTFDMVTKDTWGIWISEAPLRGGSEYDTNSTLMPAMGGRDGMARSVSKVLGRLPAKRDERNEFSWKLGPYEYLMVRFLPGGGHRWSGVPNQNYVLTNLQGDGTRAENMKLLSRRDWQERAVKEQSMQANAGRS